ncbi:MAG TPA: outer membrane protein assembly factor BamE [Bauldia sp.]|nr:outer membrane protein assembly factor BamE [Bauldia sp.]
MRGSQLTKSQRSALRAPLLLALGVALVAVAGCQTSRGPSKPGGFQMSETTQHGYVVSPEALEQIPVGSSKDQVMIALGSPSTTANYGNDVYYYISQTRYRAAAFMPDKVVDQRIVAVYFDKKDTVQRVANYGLQDGKVFDFVSQTTPTGGADESFIQQVLTGMIGMRGK